MHDKLSQAVKLYDKLLTEQVSHPPWRAAPSRLENAGYQQPTPYGQWATTSQQAPVTPMQSAQPSYFNSQPQPLSSNTPYISSPSTSSYVQTSNNSYPVSISAQSPGTEYPSYSQPQPYAVASPPPVSTSQYHSQNHVVANPYQPNTPAPPLQQPGVTYTQQIVQPPPLADQQSSPHLPSQQSPLSRHNTIASYSPAPPSFVNAQAKPPVRANTVSHAHTPQQLQQLQATTVPHQTPNFPIVPTGAPQGYQPYASNSSQPEPQREALLIDL